MAIDFEILFRLDRRNDRLGYYCHSAWGWKGRTSCYRFRWHFGKHRDADGYRW